MDSGSLRRLYYWRKEIIFNAIQTHATINSSAPYPDLRMTLKKADDNSKVDLIE